VQGFLPADKMAWPIYEVINEYKLPADPEAERQALGWDSCAAEVAPSA
jgi:hypothetical protein